VEELKHKLAVAEEKLRGYEDSPPAQVPPAQQQPLVPATSSPAALTSTPPAPTPSPRAPESYEEMRIQMMEDVRQRRMHIDNDIQSDINRIWW
jgi:hypothetical protein